ncbi:MAG: hypothetical protein ACKV2T_10770 [Kofleriaceae bacterium]
MSAIGTLGFYYLDRKPAAEKTTVHAIPAIVTVPVTTPIAPAPVVNITVQPPPAPEVPATITLPPRALTPFLDADCVARTDLSPEEEDASSLKCSWDFGFPAISDDGTTIVQYNMRDDGGRGFHHVALTFVDARTSKVLSDHTLVAPDDLDESGEATAKTRRLAAERVARLQKRLEQGNFRTMRRIASAEPIADGIEAPKGLRLEQEGWNRAARVVDGDTNTVLWRGEFKASTEYPPRKVDPDTDTGCYPIETNDVTAWFDPVTRLLVFDVVYGAGPCYCSSVVHHYVRRAATP